MFWFLILGLLGFSLIAAYRGINLMNWTIGMVLVLVGFGVLTNVSMPALVVLSVLFGAIAIPLNFKPFRRQRLSAPFLAIYRKMLPTLSDTEKVALEAGTVGWEGERRRRADRRPPPSAAQSSPQSPVRRGPCRRPSPCHPASCPCKPPRWLRPCASWPCWRR